MQKFLAVVRREYIQRVRAKMFIITTLLGPLMAVVFMVVPALLFSIKTGTTRIAIVDQTGNLYEQIRSSILARDEVKQSEKEPSVVANTGGQEQVKTAAASMPSSFEVRKVDLSLFPPSQDELAAVRKDLNAQLLKGQLDGYLVIDPGVLENGRVEYDGRNVGDIAL